MIREWTTIRCDHPACQARWPVGKNPAPFRWSYARDRAADDGWVSTREGDFCPDHTPARGDSSLALLPRIRG